MNIIAARAVAQPQLIRPRVASVFESSGPRIRLLEPIAKKPVVPPQRASKSGNEQAEPAGVAENMVGLAQSARSSRAEMRLAALKAAGRRANLQREIQPVLQQPLSSPIRSASRQPESENKPAKGGQRAETPDHKEYRPRPTAIQSESVHDEPPTISIIEEANVIESTREPAALGPIAPREARSKPPLHTGVVVRPELVLSESKAAPLEAPLPSQEELQSIHITIGRVDVRAIMSPPATTTTAIRNAPATVPMSLEEYLHKRNGA
ncbi:MAG: hypothetical protein KF814_00275 [Nitrospiraceae bacterium]|nr:hypothetical protein [Nitrospiraceae bacterium]